MEPIIYTDKVCRFFKNGDEIVRAVDNISIEVEPRTLTILKGPSGSGKTSFMNVLGGLDKPDEGKIVIDGKDISSWNDEQRDELRRKELGFIFQSIGIISYMTAWENVELGLHIAGISYDDRQPLISKALKLVDMYKRKDHRGYEMSGGEQQRVAIARAISTKPKILFADEPTSALDSHLSLGIVEIFKRLVRDEKMTILMTSHDPQMIEVADFLFELIDGKIDKRVKVNG